jgi:hypothetical protein
MYIFRKLAVVIAFSLSISASICGCARADNKTIHGRSKYEQIENREWIFFATRDSSDFYIGPKGEQDGDIYQIDLRSVSQGVDNFGPVRIDCAKRMISAYYEAWEAIPAGKSIANDLYQRFCPGSLSDDKLPLRQGMPYAQARESLIKAGWQTKATRWQEKSCSRTLGSRCRYPEVESCSETGTGSCIFKWVDAKGRRLIVHTNSDRNGNTWVANWALR